MPNANTDPLAELRALAAEQDTANGSEAQATSQARVPTLEWFKDFDGSQYTLVMWTGDPAQKMRFRIRHNPGHELATAEKSWMAADYFTGWVGALASEADAKGACEARAARPVSELEAEEGPAIQSDNAGCQTQSAPHGETDDSEANPVPPTRYRDRETGQVHLAYQVGSGGMPDWLMEEGAFLRDGPALIVPVTGDELLVHPGAWVIRLDVPLTAYSPDPFARLDEVFRVGFEPIDTPASRRDSDRPIKHIDLTPDTAPAPALTLAGLLAKGDQRKLADAILAWIEAGGEHVKITQLSEVAQNGRSSSLVLTLERHYPAEGETSEVDSAHVSNVRRV